MQKDLSTADVSKDRASKMSLFTLFAVFSCIVAAVYFAVSFQESGNIFKVSFSSLVVTAVIILVIAVIGILLYVGSEIIPVFVRSVQDRISCDSLSYVNSLGNTKLKRRKYTKAGALMALGTLVCVIYSSSTTAGGLWFSIVKDSASAWKLFCFFGTSLVLPLILGIFLAILIKSVNTPLKAKSKILKSLSVLMILAILAFVITMTFFASTTTSVIGMAGDITNKAYYVDFVSGLKEEVDKNFAFKQKEQGVIQKFKSQREYWGRKAGAASKVEFTGSQGKGALFNYLKGIEGLYPVIKLEDASFIKAKKDKLLKEINKLSDKLKAIPSETFRYNPQNYTAEVNSLCSDINQFIDNDGIVKISIAVDGMDFNKMKTGSKEGTSKNLVLKQSTKVQEAEDTLRMKRSSMLRSLTDLSESKPKVISFSPLDSFDTVLLYWNNSGIRFFWAICLFADITPVIFFLLNFCYGGNLIYRKEDEFLEVNSASKAESDSQGHQKEAA